MEFRPVWISRSECGVSADERTRGAWLSVGAGPAPIPDHQPSHIDSRKPPLYSANSNLVGFPWRISVGLTRISPTAAHLGDVPDGETHSTDDPTT